MNNFKQILGMWLLALVATFSFPTFASADEFSTNPGGQIPGSVPSDEYSTNPGGSPGNTTQLTGTQVGSPSDQFSINRRISNPGPNASDLYWHRFHPSLDRDLTPAERMQELASLPEDECGLLQRLSQLLSERLNATQPVGLLVVNRTVFTTRAITGKLAGLDAITNDPKKLRCLALWGTVTNFVVKNIPRSPQQVEMFLTSPERQRVVGIYDFLQAKCLCQQTPTAIAQLPPIIGLPVQPQTPVIPITGTRERKPKKLPTTNSVSQVQPPKDSNGCPENVPARTSWSLGSTDTSRPAIERNIETIFFNQYPELRDTPVRVIHSTSPSIVSAYPGLFSSNEVNYDIRNLRGVCRPDCPDEAAIEARWKTFIGSHAKRDSVTRQQILNFSRDNIDAVFADCFYPLQPADQDRKNSECPLDPNVPYRGNVGSDLGLPYVQRLRGGTENSPSYSSSFFRTYPEYASEKNDVIIHHAVPQVLAVKYGQLFSWKEMHSPSNLRGICKSEKYLHDEISARWNNWLSLRRNDPKHVWTRREAIDFANEIDKEFGQRFYPRMP